MRPRLGCGTPDMATAILLLDQNSVNSTTSGKNKNTQSRERAAPVSDRQTPNGPSRGHSIPDQGIAPFPAVQTRTKTGIPSAEAGALTQFDPEKSPGFGLRPTGNTPKKLSANNAAQHSANEPPQGTSVPPASIRTQAG